MTMRTYEFDDEVMKPETFRFCVIRTTNVRKKYGKSLLPKLIAREKGRCPYCPVPLSRGPIQVDHRKTVRQYAYDLKIPLTTAYLKCHSLRNLQAVHSKCNNARNRRRKTK